MAGASGRGCCRSERRDQAPARLDTTSTAGLRWKTWEALRGALELDGQPVLGGTALTRPDGSDTIVSLITELSPSTGLWAAGRLWAGEAVVAAVVLDATLETPLGEVPLGTRLEHTLTWR